MDSYIWGTVQDQRIMGMALYAQGQFVYGISKDMKGGQPFAIQIVPPELVPVIGADQGIEYLKTNGCNINNQRLRFVRDDHDDDLNAKFIILAGHDTEEDGQIASGAFIYVTENNNVILITYGHGQEKGPANVCAFDIVSKLVDSGY